MYILALWPWVSHLAQIQTNQMTLPKHQGLPMVTQISSTGRPKGLFDFSFHA